MVNVRVRGIYATAISKILFDSGFKLIEVSDKVKERLGLEFEVAPCDVTVKDTDSPDELLIVGFPKEAKAVYDALVDKLKYVFTWLSPIELHSVYVGIVVEKRGEVCVVDIGGIKGALYPCKEDSGNRIVVGVKKPPVKPGEKLQLTRNFRIVGKYIALQHGDPRITFSEHIYDPGVKAKLSTIAISKLIGTGLGVHFRSSSKFAEVETILGEIDSLLTDYRNLLRSAESLNNPTKLRNGESIALLGLTSLAKKLLDNYRRQVTFTVDMHHSLKSMGLSDLVDFAEHVFSHSGNTKGEGTGSGIASYIVKEVARKGEVELVHVRPTGDVLRLHSGKVVSARTLGDRIVIVIERTIRSEGLYDGLGTERKPGDVDYVVVDTSRPAISHNYFRGGSWLGSYININTPPEVSPGVVKYHDLLVDVVVYPSGEIRIVDLEELENAHRQGLVTNALYNYAKNAVEHVLSSPSSYVFNPLRSLEK